MAELDSDSGLVDFKARHLEHDAVKATAKTKSLLWRKASGLSVRVHLLPFRSMASLAGS